MSKPDSYPVGSLVEIGPAYIGNNRYKNDGWVGVFTVTQNLGGGYYRLARGDRRAEAKPDYHVTLHKCRIMAQLDH